MMPKGYSLLNRIKSARGPFMNMVPRRGFNQKFDTFLENLIERLPGNSFASLVVLLNTLFYVLYLTWPSYNIHSYLNNFSFNIYGLSRGYLHSLFTCHFAHQSFFSWLIDSVIIFLLSQSLEMMYGKVFVAKTIIMSMMMGSFFLYAYHSANKGMLKPYQGNDAILRGIIFSIIFTNPQQTFMLFPIPVQIPAWAVALLLLGIDFLHFNVAAFGGVSGAYAMVNYLI